MWNRNTLIALFILLAYLFATGDCNLLQLPVAELGIGADGEACGRRNNM